MNNIKAISKIIIAIIFVLYIFYLNVIVSTETSGQNALLLYRIFSVILALFVLFYMFIKKAQIYRVLIVIFCCLIFFNNIPIFNNIFDKDFCLDNSKCREGLEVNTKYGLIKINEANCLKYNWNWDKKSKICTIKN